MVLWSVEIQEHRQESSEIQQHVVIAIMKVIVIAHSFQLQGSEQIIALAAAVPLGATARLSEKQRRSAPAKR